MHHSLLIGTFIFLIGYFGLVEWYRQRFSIPGEIIAIRPIFPGLEHEIGYLLDVKLKTGHIVSASAEPCAVCMNPFKPGDNVYLIRQQQKYIVHNSLIRSAIHPPCVKHTP
jgi:hypothetical protein